MSDSKILTSAFRQSAIASGLVTRKQVDEALLGLQAESETADTAIEINDESIAECLVQAELLTSYQAEQLKQGRTKLKLGSYIIIDWIAQGGMGQVFKGMHELLGRESAVKVLPLSKATDDAKNNFIREVRTQAKLDHPNLVRAYDAGEDGNVHYLVVEYVAGTDLRRLVRTEKRLSMQQAASIIRQAATGLQYAHDQGLIHRDVKPGNILVTPDGEAKVSDLGLAGYINEAGEDPRAGKVVGTADYLAPEQIRTPNDITHLIDIYSLGCTLYYAITGKVPYPGGSPSNKAIRHCHETPWHPRRFNPDVTEEFVEIIADMMEKESANRIQSMQDVAARLEHFALDATPIPSQHMSKSPWAPPPPPSASDEPIANLHETGSGDYDLSDQGESSTSQVSQVTDSHSGQATERIQPPRPPALPNKANQPKYSIGIAVGSALAIAVPLALAIGFAIGFAMGMMSNTPG